MSKEFCETQTQKTQPLSAKYGILSMETSTTYIRRPPKGLRKNIVAHIQAKHHNMAKFFNDILMSFRPCFSRNATFEWFVIIVTGLLVRTDHLGVTSIIRGLFLSADYMGLIGFFRSSAWTLGSLTAKWCALVKQNAPLVRYGDAVVMIGDGVKKSKEGRRMPGVKRHHQESNNSSKAGYMWGHLFGSVGILAEKTGKSFCLPLALMLQDGVKNIFGWDEPAQRQGSHVVEMIKLANRMAMHFGKTILLLDRLYLSVPALRTMEELNAKGHFMHIVTKAKRNCVAYQLPVATPGKRGRPRKKGATVRPFKLFETEPDRFDTAEIRLYGKLEKVRYCSMDLLWGQKMYKMLRFVLVEYNHTWAVLVSTDLAMNPLDIVQLYGKRFGIEVMFREMKQVICAFGYRFWSKHMPKLNRFQKKNDPDPVKQVVKKQAQQRIKLTIKAIEGFMFCSIVSAGLLQIAALRFSATDELANLRYLRTCRNSIASEATVADFLQKNFISLLQRTPDLTLNQIISAKQRPNPDTDCWDDTA